MQFLYLRTYRGEYTVSDKVRNIKIFIFTLSVYAKCCVFENYFFPKMRINVRSKIIFVIRFETPYTLKEPNF